ncbi:S-adenosyl-L-methionine-dependent methyltransferase [Calocera cornea HHB12733]|uniref:S-adenosyl-L-methionine-dependent methyltransferase n=1 Tax=Calocera cornea HHB12733 TaxID=1353952 RepID=A0A165CYL9_9BASI|nr:S-adenosyl-L-methionine-dependent methyltransferase [Calocera cornea HHB12733]
MAVSAQYDNFANVYTESTLLSLHNAYIERPAMLEYIGQVKDLDVLDLGCGTMVLGSKLLEAGAASFTGIDASAEMLNIAKTRIKQEWKSIVSLREGDLNEPFDFGGAEFDIIASSLALHYLASWEPVLTSARGALKDNGRFVFSVHHPFADWLNHPEVGPYYGGPTLLHEEWKTAGKETIKLSFYRRPLEMICKEIADAGWKIDRIAEPRPTPESKAFFEPARWERASSKPSFIIFVLRKPMAD